MGYLHIDNLYNVPEALQCYALEKIHGTSAHIKYCIKVDDLIFFSGGVSQCQFESLFDKNNLKKRLWGNESIIYGEAFGGKCQGMSEVYGKDLRFIAFDVNVGGTWLDVPSAEMFVKELGLQFVPYERGPLTLEWLNEQRDKASLVAVVPDAIREGIVIRPIYEATLNNGKRMIYKHKRDEFREVKTPREVDPHRQIVLENAHAIAAEYVTLMRLQHVLQKTPYNGVEDTGNVVRAMIEDVKRESATEVTWSRDIEKFVGKMTANLLHSFKFSDEGAISIS